MSRSLKESKKIKVGARYEKKSVDVEKKFGPVVEIVTRIRKNRELRVGVRSWSRKKQCDFVTLLCTENRIRSFTGLTAGFRFYIIITEHSRLL